MSIAVRLLLYASSIAATERSQRAAAFPAPVFVALLIPVLTSSPLFPPPSHLPAPNSRKSRK